MKILTKRSSPEHTSEIYPHILKTEDLTLLKLSHLSQVRDLLESPVFPKR